MHAWRYMKYDGLNSVSYTLVKTPSNAELEFNSTSEHTSSQQNSIGKAKDVLFRHIKVSLEGASSMEDTMALYIERTQKLNDRLKNDTAEFERVRGILEQKDILNAFIFSLRRGDHGSSTGIFKSFLSFVLGM